MVHKEIPEFWITYNEQKFMIENPDVVIKKRLNEHTKATMSAIVSKDHFDYFTLHTNTKTKISFTYKTEEKEELLLFVGIITNIQTKTEGIAQNAVYYIDLEAISYSYLMDIQYKNRSFQNVDMTYEQLLNIIVRDCQYNGDFMNALEEDFSLNCFTLQYRETDWEFLKRMASRFHMPLVVDDKKEVPRIKFGISFYEKVAEFKNYNYKAIKNIEKHRTISQNYQPDYLQTDTLFYEMITKEDKSSFEIGDTVEFRDVLLQIYAVDILVKDHILSHIYTISSKDSFYQPNLFNHNIVGLSLKGKVLEVAKNQLRVHLDIDQEAPPVPYWFTYATLYSTWYCMPEVGDYVNTYFPTNREEDGIVINSVKQTPSAGFARERAAAAQSSAGEQTANATNQPVDFETLAGDEKVKMLVTEQGKMIILDDRNGVVTILCNNGTYVTLSDTAGISIITNNDVSINGKQNISMTSKEKIYMQAETEIKLESGGSSMILEPSNIKAKANDIYLNE